VARVRSARRAARDAAMIVVLSLSHTIALPLRRQRHVRCYVTAPMDAATT